MFPQQRSSMTIHSDTSFNCAVTSIHRNSLFTNMNMNLSMEHLTCIHVLYIHDIVPCESRLTGFQTCFFRNAVILGTKIRHQSQKHLQDLVSMRWHSVKKLLRLKTQRSKARPRQGDTYWTGLKLTTTSFTNTDLLASVSRHSSSVCILITFKRQLFASYA